MSLKQIAQEAGVSAMTVSRVLNLKGPVAEETRKRVLEISQRHGLLPEPTGKRAPRYGGKDVRAGTMVAVLIDTAISTIFISELIVSIQRELATNNFQCVIHSYSGEYADFIRATAGIRPPATVACLAVGHFSDNEVRGILSANPLTVFVDYAPSPTLDCPINVVNYDNHAAVRLGVQQLLRSGCQRLVCLHGLPAHSFSRIMVEAFRAALAEHPAVQGQVLAGDFSPSSGYEAIRRALSEGARFDGLFTTDEMAFGAMRALREAGLRVPEDVRVMGCDDIELGRELTPPLSTVALDRRTLGRRAVRRLLEVMNNTQPTEPEQILLPPSLVLRGTCPAAPAAAVTPLASAPRASQQ